MAATELSAWAPARPAAPRPPSMWRAWAHAYALLWAFTLGSALLITITPGASVLARELLHLKLGASTNPPSSLAIVASIAANNMLRSSWPLALGPLGAGRNRFTRALADGAVLANLLVAGLLVGGALGGYGTRVLPYLPNVPVEWAGIASGTAGWFIERRRPLIQRERVAVSACTAALLICAAICESCLSP